MCKLKVTLETILKSKKTASKLNIKIKQLAEIRNYQSKRNNGVN